MRSISGYVADAIPRRRVCLVQPLQVQRVLRDESLPGASLWFQCRLGDVDVGHYLVWTETLPLVENGLVVVLNLMEEMERAVKLSLRRDPRREEAEEDVILGIFPAGEVREGATRDFVRSH